MQNSWLVCTRTSAYLEGIDDILVARTGSAHAGLNAIVQSLVKMRGKKIRPALLLLSSSFGPGFSSELQYPAAAMELMHVASLYHDDVMDQSLQRRQSPSANQRWGNTAAIHAGSFLFARAMNILSDLGPEISLAISRSLSNLCLGQLKESENCYNLEATLEDHLIAIAQKTASLFELPCRLGALLAEADPAHVKALGQFGHDLGMAFQLIDDLLDIAGDALVMGKQPGTDIREGVYTHAVILALQNPTLKKRLSKIFLLDHIAEAELAEAVEIVCASGAIEATYALADDYVASALAAIQTLPDTPARQSLHHLATFVTTRKA